MKRKQSRRIGTGFMTLEDRVLMVADMFIRTDRLDSSSISPGGIAVLSEFEMIGAQNSPNQIVLGAIKGFTSVGSQYQLRADMRGADGLPGVDGIYETLADEARIGAAGNIVFDLNANFGRTLARNGTPLQVQGRINANAPAGQLQLGKPWIGYTRSETRPNTFHIGAKQNPVLTIRPATTNNVSYSFSSPSGTFTPGDNDVTLGTLTVNTSPGNGYYILNQSLAIEGRAADGTPLPNVAGLMQDVEVRNTATGAVSHGTSVASIPGLSIVRFSNIYVDGTGTFEIRADQEGGVATAGQKFRAHVVTELSSSANTINIAGLTGPTTDYRLQAFDADGRDTLVVSPGGVLAGNFRTVAVPTLRAIEKAIPSTNVAVANEDNILLGRMEFTASGGDQLLTSVKFNVMEGNGRNLDHVAVLMDSDGNGTADMVVANPVHLTEGAVDSFMANLPIPWEIEDGETVAMELWGDVASSLPAVNPTVRTGLASFEAERLDNGAPVTEVIGGLTPQTLWNFVNQGDLFVTLDSTPTPFRYLLGGVLEQSIFRLQLRAQHEDVDVYKLYVSMAGVVGSIDRLELLKDGATTPFAIATISGVGSDPVPAGFTTFAAHMISGQLVIPEGANLDVIVRPRMKTDEQGAMSGEGVKPNMVVVGGFQPVLARGRSSSNNLAPNNGDTVASGEVFVGVDIVGPNADVMGMGHTVTMAKATGVRNANPNADNTAVPTGISGIGQWQITTADHQNSGSGSNNFELGNPVIMVTAANVLLNADAFRFYNKADATVVSANIIVRDGAGNIVSGNATGVLFVEVDLRSSLVDRMIGRGESKTFVLEANILNPKVVANRNSALEMSLLLNETTWADPDGSIAGFDDVFTGLGLSDTISRSTRYVS